MKSIVLAAMAVVISASSCQTLFLQPGDTATIVQGGRVAGPNHTPQRVGGPGVSAMLDSTIIIDGGQANGGDSQVNQSPTLNGPNGFAQPGIVAEGADVEVRGGTVTGGSVAVGGSPAEAIRGRSFLSPSGAPVDITRFPSLTITGGTILAGGFTGDPDAVVQLANGETASTTCGLGTTACVQPRLAVVFSGTVDISGGTFDRREGIEIQGLRRIARFASSGTVCTTRMVPGSGTELVTVPGPEPRTTVQIRGGVFEGAVTVGGLSRITGGSFDVLETEGSLGRNCQLAPTPPACHELRGGDVRFVVHSADDLYVFGTDISVTGQLRNDAITSADELFPSVADNPNPLVEAISDTVLAQDLGFAAVSGTYPDGSPMNFFLGIVPVIGNTSPEPTELPRVFFVGPNHPGCELD